MQKKIENSNMFRKFQLHSMQIFLKMATSNSTKNEKVASTPLPSDFGSLPYPRVRWYPPMFVIKITAKYVKEIAFIYAIGHFL